eukprot:TRINITY_DN20565_c0_g1_i6.p1 TRINITY_DN20565_c0_g1~~TRINITY_DN20565_c0_g1_i6.p1  ORF type:complete len:208 (-),score=28.85 TRINITY_DN20565_c0_g1_i6:282-905(-)
MAQAGRGALIYGGYVAYDSDAKRQFLGVGEADVYSARCAREMAERALAESRALVAVAVTGFAGPTVPLHRSFSLGNVDIAVVMRRLESAARSDVGGSSGLPHKMLHYDFCGRAGSERTRELCQMLTSGKMIEAVEDKASQLRAAIRFETAAAAMYLVQSFLIETCIRNGTSLCTRMRLILPAAPYDGKYAAYGEPSEIIAAHMQSGG